MCVGSSLKWTLDYEALVLKSHFDEQTPHAKHQPKVWIGISSRGPVDARHLAPKSTAVSSRRMPPTCRMHFLNSTARSSRSPEPAQQPHIPDQAMEHMPDFPRSIGVVPPRNFNTRDRHAAFEVELVKFGALVTAFLPAVLEVGADGILLRQMVGRPPARPLRVQAVHPCSAWRARLSSPGTLSQSDGDPPGRSAHPPAHPPTPAHPLPPTRAHANPPARPPTPVCRVMVSRLSAPSPGKCYMVGSQLTRCAGAPALRYSHMCPAY